LELHDNLKDKDGTTNYLKGLMLVLCYLIVAASFFVHVDPQSITAQEEEVYQDCFLLKILVILALRGHLTTREGSVLPGRAERASFFFLFWEIEEQNVLKLH